MHRIDADSHVGNLFDEGDPGVPREPTQVDADWLNAVQEELAGVVIDAGISLVKGTNTQLLSGLRTLFVRAAGNATQTVTGSKTFSGLVSIIKAAGSGLANLAIQNLDTTNDSHAISATSSSVGTCAKFTNTSTGRAAQFQSADGYSTIRLVPLTTIPPSGADGDICYVAGGLNMFYGRISGVWTSLGT